MTTFTVNSIHFLLIDATHTDIMTTRSRKTKFTIGESKKMSLEQYYRSFRLHLSEY